MSKDPRRDLLKEMGVIQLSTTLLSFILYIFCHNFLVICALCRRLKCTVAYTALTVTNKLLYFSFMHLFKTFEDKLLYE